MKTLIVARIERYIGPTPHPLPLWQVVVNLILDMHRLGHESYASLDEEEVRQRAANLPVNGVPPEVLKVVKEVDSSHEKLQPQKAATPCDGMADPSTAGKLFAAQRPRAIVAEGYSMEDANHKVLTALQDMEAKLTTDFEREAALSLEVRTGNEFVDQFQPWYFPAAFPFCFKYGTACPDVINTCKPQQGGSEEDVPRRHAGNPKAPAVQIQTWAAAMARRAESQFQRDWTFGFTLWNYLFRTMVNLQPNSYIYPTPAGQGKSQEEINKEIAAGAKQILQTLRHGQYVDITGEKKNVNGDLTKLRHVPGLGEPAKKLLGDAEARARNIPGTHEVRKAMRHQTHANRVCYGTPIFLTFSPSERDTALMVRLARARQSDPAIIADGSGPFQQRSKPNLDMDFMRLSPEALAEDLFGFKTKGRTLKWFILDLRCSCPL